MTASKIFNKVFAKRSLVKIFVNHIAESTAMGMDRIRAKNYQSVLSKEIEGILHRIHASKYKFTSYKQKLVSKGANQLPRTISIPTVRDRLTLRALCDFFIRLYPELNLDIPQVKIELLKKAISSNAYDSFIKIDLSSFYTSIPQDLLIKKLRKKIRKKEILKVINDAIQTPTTVSGKSSINNSNFNGVPQGLAISNVLAEIYINDFDINMNRASFFYARYVDDILILCKSSDIKPLTDEAYKRLTSLKLKPHEMSSGNTKSVSGNLADGFDFLGYSIQHPKISVRKSTLERFESGIASVFTTYRYQLSKASSEIEKQRAINICEWRLNLKVTGCIYDGKRLGWMFYFSQIDTSSPLRSLDSTIKSLTNRFQLKGKIKVKSLVKTFYETQRVNKHSHKYIPNFDNLPISEMRRILECFLVSKSLAGYTDKQIKLYFRTRISTVVKELERDLIAIS